MEEQNNEEIENEMWVVVELMGHDVTAGIMKPSSIGGLMKLDVPIEDGFRSEFIGPGAVFRIKVVSEEIARVYARPSMGIIEYDAPIVPRAQYEAALQKARNENSRLMNQITTLNQRLTAVNALPGPDENKDDMPF